MKIYLFFIVLSCSIQSFTMDRIELASAEDLHKRLLSLQCDDFFKHSNILTTLGGQKKLPHSIAISIELALYDYNQYKKDPALEQAMQLKKPHIIREILKEHPSAIESLHKKGLLDAFI